MHICVVKCNDITNTYHPAPELDHLPFLTALPYSVLLPTSGDHHYPKNLSSLFLSV